MSWRDAIFFRFYKKNLKALAVTTVLDVVLMCSLEKDRAIQWLLIDDCIVTSRIAEAKQFLGSLANNKREAG